VCSNVPLKHSPILPKDDKSTRVEENISHIIIINRNKAVSLINDPKDDKEFQPNRKSGNSL